MSLREAGELPEDPEVPAEEEELVMEVPLGEEELEAPTEEAPPEEGGIHTSEPPTETKEVLEELETVLEDTSFTEDGLRSAGVPRSRRRELTPGRQVRFDSPGETSEESGDEVVALRRKLRFVTIQKETAEREREQAKKDLKDVKRSSRSSHGSDYSDAGGGSNFARPKLRHPWIFEGSYTEVLNVLNWLAAVARYLEHCRVDLCDFSGYARSYMSDEVQAWMDATFFNDLFPNWDLLKEEMINRYMEADHKIRLELKFSRLRQHTTLAKYVEIFQQVESALLFAQVHIEDHRKVLQFIQGMTQHEDRRFMLEKQPRNLKDVFANITILRQAKTLSTNTVGGFKSQRSLSRGKGRRRSKSPEREFQQHQKRLNKLEGKAREKAWELGNCLGCGQPGHMIKNCEELKKEAARLGNKIGQRVFKKFTRKFSRAPYSSAATKGSKSTPKKKRFHKLEKEGEEEGEESSSEESSTSEEEKEEDSTSSSGSENNDPEFEG